MKLAFLLPFSLMASIPFTTAWAAESSSQKRLLEPGLFSFAELVREVKPSVVNIRLDPSSSSSKESRDEDHSFWSLFGRTVPKEYRERSLGTGFIIRKEGLILTNHHVIENMDKAIVKLSNEQEFEAVVVGRDEKLDIALLKIKGGKDFPVVRIGDSHRLEVGEWVVAIGNPFGLEQTVTVGIVSAKGRVIGTGPYDDYIQTDASINPGNSGGPLFNVKGEVVGINSALRSQGSGIGFAIPIHQVLRILPQLEQYGKVTRGWLGVMIQDLNEEESAKRGIMSSLGILIADVFEGSPADHAGLLKGDIIVEFDGQRTVHSRILPFLVAGTPVGKTVSVKALRDGSEESFSVVIGKLTENR